MSFYSDQATQFQQIAASIQTRLTNEGSTLDATTYTSLEDQRDALLDNVNAMVTADIQATLAQLKLDQPRLAQCTASLNAAVKTLQKFDQIAAVVAAAVTLATAIASADPGAIASAVVGAEKAVTGMLAKPNVVTMPQPAAAPGTGSLTGTVLAIAASDDSAEPGS
jgi:hypothetical protein